MKKLLLLLTLTGIAASTAFSQTAPFDLYEGELSYPTIWLEANETAIKINPMYNGGNLILNNPDPVGVAYLKSQIEDNNFSDEGLIVYYLTDLIG